MNIKKEVGYRAAGFVEPGMVVGLGTGSTAYYLVEALGKRIKNENLDIVGVTTSNRTREQAISLGIPLTELDKVESIDVTIDGADEISDAFQGIKGGGGSLLFEKIVASNTKRNIWIVDESKLVNTLGRFPLAIEVVKFGSKNLFSFFEKSDMAPSWRLTDTGGKFITDDNNYIIDLNLNEIERPEELATWLSSLTGVVEHGLFLNTVETIIVGNVEGTEVIDT